MSTPFKILCLLSIVILAVSPAANPGHAAPGTDNLPALAASNGLDPTFTPFFASPGVVRGILPLAAGKVLIYGSLTTVNGQARNRIAILNADGSLDPGFIYSPELTDDTIYTVIAVSDGKILVGGNMLWFGTAKVQRYLFRLNPDGSLDSTFDASSISGVTSFGLDGPVTALCLDGDGKILVAGNFTSPHTGITRLTANGAPDPSFNPGSGANGRVTRIALQQSGGKIILAGAFSQVAGTPAGGLARLDANGTLDSAFFGSGVSGYSPGGGASGVSALAVQANDDVLVGGGFASIKGQSAPLLARIKADGSVDSTFQPFIRGYLEEITSVLSVGNQIIVGGWNPVMYINGDPTGHEAQVYVLQSADGGFTSYMPFRGKDTDVFALAQRSDGKIVAGGSFIQSDDPVNPQYFGGLFQFTLNPSGPDFSYRPVVGGQAAINDLAVQNDGSILVSGSFYRSNGGVNNGLVRLNSSGAQDSSFSAPGHDFTAVAVRPDQKIVAASAGFTNDIYPPNLALLKPDGSIEASATAHWQPNSIIVQPDSKAVVTLYWQPGVLRLNPDLTEDTVFSANRGDGISNSQQPDLEFDRVNVAALQGEHIIVGGSFSTFSGAPHQNLVRLDANGTPDVGFGSPAFTVYNFRSEVFALAVQPDGRILVGGRFSSVGGVANPSLARLNPDGSLDATFQSPFVDSGANVYALALQPDGKILAGGDIWIQDGSNIYTGLVRLNPDGSRDPSFTANTKGTVNTLAFVSPNQVLLGGSFYQVDGLPRQALARYLVNVDPPALTGNYADGAPGSFFTVTGLHFFPNAPLQITVNGHALGSVQTGADGTVVFILQSALVTDPGAYCIRLFQGVFDPAAALTQISPLASFWIHITPAAPLRAKEGALAALPIPSGIAYQQFFIPVVRR